jgi:phytol kinase
MMQQIVALIPDARTAALVGAIALGYGAIAASIAAWLRVRRGVRTPYTRKTFHFLIMTCTLLIQLEWGAAGVVAYGSGIALLVLYACWRGSGFPFYEAVARPSDEPHRTRYIIIPLITTALGGLLANLFFPAYAQVAYLSVAWGDAVGEPVGTRWGRHRYRVPSLFGVPATRSVEGSAAVWLATSAAAAIALVLSGETPQRALGAALLIGAAGAAAEAVSHHGLDNLTIQLVTAAAAAALLG